MQSKKKEILVGLFVVIALVAIIFLCFKVSNIKLFSNKSTYSITASFTNIGGLRVNSPVKIGGVVVGRIVDIILDKKYYTPLVTLAIFSEYKNIPENSSLSILTTGILGEQFLSINLGFYDPDMGITFLRDGGHIYDTKSAILLEELIGKLIFPSPSTSTNNNSSN